MKRGLLKSLGISATAAMIEEATGIKAFVIGKPNPVMMRSARKYLGLETAETTVIGDTMETDIFSGETLNNYRQVLMQRYRKGHCQCWKVIPYESPHLSGRHSFPYFFLQKKR
jgi:hypothetical protein